MPCLSHHGKGLAGCLWTGVHSLTPLLLLLQDSEGVKLEPNTARAGIAAVLNDPASSKGKYHVVEVGGSERWFAPLLVC